MGWVKMDDRYRVHRKVMALSPSAVVLDVFAMQYSSDFLTDGKIETQELRNVAPSLRQVNKLAVELVQAGRWKVIPEGWVIHDYLEYNPSRESVLAKRAAEKEKKAAQRAKGAFKTGPDARRNSDYINGDVPGGQNEESPGDNIGTQEAVPEGHEGVSPATPSRPVPLTSSSSELDVVPPTVVEEDAIEREAQRRLAHKIATQGRPGDERSWLETVRADIRKNGVPSPDIPPHPANRQSLGCENCDNGWTFDDDGMAHACSTCHRVGMAS